METIKMEKFEATKRNKKNMQLLPALLQLCLRVVMLGLFMSSPLWLPVLCSSARFFFMETLPGVCALLSGPKCLFIISNVIIIFLVGESKLSRSTSPQPDIYEAYVAHRQSLQKTASAGDDAKICEEPVAEVTVLEEALPVVQAKEVEDEMVQEEECGKEEEEIEREREEEFESEEQEEEVEKEEQEEEEEEEEGEEDEMGLPAEELNRRVEDFIAKVNMQRKLEARMLLLCY